MKRFFAVLIAIAFMPSMTGLVSAGKVPTPRREKGYSIEH